MARPIIGASAQPVTATALGRLGLFDQSILAALGHGLSIIVVGRTKRSAVPALVITRFIAIDFTAVPERRRCAP